MALLTAAELRKHLTDYPEGADNDDALRRLLEAAEAAIDGVAGPVGEVTEYSGGGWRTIALNRPASSITSISEDFTGTPVTLAADDYQISPSGYVLTRLTGGTNSRSSWYGQVRVVYTPADDVAQREAAAILLVQGFLNYHPGLSMQTIGSWQEQFGSNSTWNWSVERQTILNTLSQRSPMVVI